MKQTRKRIGSLILSVCMVFTLLPTMAFAEAQEESEPTVTAEPAASTLLSGIAPLADAIDPCDAIITAIATLNEELTRHDAAANTLTAVKDADNNTVTITSPNGEVELWGGVSTGTAHLSIPEGLTVKWKAKVKNVGISAMIVLENGSQGTLEICTDSTIDASAGGGISCPAGSTLVISGGEINVTKDSTVTAPSYGVDSQGTVRMTGGTVEVSGKNSIGLWLSGSTASLDMSGGMVTTLEQGSCGIYLMNRATASMSGGTVQANYASGTNYGIWVNNSTSSFTLSGGTVEANGLDARAVYCYGYYGGTANITGGLLSAKNKGSALYVQDQGVANISGGMIMAGTDSYALKALEQSTSYFYVTGGSISGKTTGLADGTLKNRAGGDPVYPVTLTNLPNSKTITALSSPVGYGINDVSTDSDGKLYVYVPTGKTVFVLTADGKSYAGRVYPQSGGSTLAMIQGEASDIPNEITVLTQPKDSTVDYNTGTSISVSAVAGDDSAVSHQWYSNTSKSNTGGTTVSGATTNTLTIPANQAVGIYYYYCVLTATGAADVTTEAVTVIINKAAITITAKNKTAYIGDAVPGLSTPVLGTDYTVTGLAAGETLKTAPTLTYSDTPDMAKAGTYTITASAAAVPDGGNYNSTITYMPGTLTVSAKPSNGGSSGGGSTTPSTGIPVSDLSDGKKSDVTVKSNAGTVTLPSDMLSNLDAPKAAKAEIKITAVRPSNLTAQAQSVIGNRPIVSINLLINGKVTDWNNPKVPVTVSIPYVPTAEELANPEGITAYYIDSKGNLTEMVGAKYDPTTKSVVFQTTHFSYYAVGYQAAAAAKMQFGDVLPGAWYYKAVSFCVEKGITNGTSKTTFSPNATLTRGQFITMLLKAYGIESAANPTDNFADAGNTYYSGYLAAAKAKGISNGVGDNKFAPEKAITRQEMFTLLYNALKVLDKLPTTDNGKAVADFSDSGDVASWATESMAALVKSGTFSGNGGKLDPTGGSTRVQMAQVLYNLLGK